jgi:tryptophan-rich sensory protein
MKKRLDKAITFLICLLIVAVVAVLGSLFTDIGAWYYSIRPALTPPNWVFPIVWNILFFLIALSLYFAWNACEKKKKKCNILFFFGLNFLFNVLWTFFYFTLQNPLLAFFDILLLLATIIILIIKLRKISVVSSSLLIPYLAWVMFASILNLLSI